MSIEADQWCQREKSNRRRQISGEREKNGDCENFSESTGFLRAC